MHGIFNQQLNHIHNDKGRPMHLYARNIHHFFYKMTLAGIHVWVGQNSVSLVTTIIYSNFIGNIHIRSPPYYIHFHTNLQSTYDQFIFLIAFYLIIGKASINGQL